MQARARRSRRHLCLRGTSLFASGKCSRLSACRSSPRVWDLFALAAVDGGKWQPITVSVCVSRKARSAPEEMDRRDSNDLSPFTFVMEPIRLPLMSLLFHLGPLTFFLPEIVCSASRVATLNLSHPPPPGLSLSHAVQGVEAWWWGPSSVTACQTCSATTSTEPTSCSGTTGTGPSLMWPNRPVRGIC